ncbi:phage tail sheath family protein [Nonomuraea sediminis]|uniref:phage tail sheath family protein n=1 Tax=Nonomuraea sediminis TaxID=2835864 RepID=UPI001BDD8090|nr:phage tail sheath subtilisin-like domain-containing protein [Nonomuraea sediminis]
MSENVQSPGVYVFPADSGSRPIEGVGTAVAAFVGFASMGPSEPTLVTSWTQYTKVFGSSFAGGLLAHAVYGFFLNGGSACYVVRIGGDGAAPTPVPQAMLGSFRIVAKELPEGEGSAISVSVTEAPVPEGEEPSDERFTITVKRGGEVKETFEFPPKSGKGSLATVVRQSKLIKVEETGAELATLEPKTVTLTTPAAPPVLPAKMTPDVYIGSEDERSGVKGLAAIDEVTMIAMPDLMGAFERGAIDADGVKSVQNELNAHCAEMKDRMAILDAPPGLSAQGMLEWHTTLNLDSMWATLYHPWIKVFDPETKGTRRIPPSGHIAGIWARSDATRGVHKAPANEVIQGAIALESQLTRKEQDLINPHGINCIRVMPGRGIRVWGARTLATTDTQWRYLNIRRLFNYLQESIINGTQWVVFEPNDDALWARIRRTIAAFLVMEWRRGALFGLTPDEAFYVKCDRDTNPAESIEQGKVVCEIGVAPVKPAEFVIFHLAQMASGVSLVSE